MTNPPTVYIAHRYGGSDDDRYNNLRAAVAWFGWLAWRYDIIPVASWLTLVQAWPDEEEYQKLGLQIDHDQVMGCDAVVLCGPVVSVGMAQETRDHRLRVDLTTLGMRSVPGHYDTDLIRKIDELMLAAGLRRR